MRDHEVNIVKSAAEHTEYLREAIEEETEHEFYLDVEVFRSNSDRHRVEFLLTYGGPIVRVIVDQYDTVTFYHSWGADDRKECDLWDDDAELWKSQAEQYIEMMEV